MTTIDAIDLATVLGGNNSPAPDAAPAPQPVANCRVARPGPMRMVTPRMSGQLGAMLGAQIRRYFSGEPQDCK